uniref:Uncharacterized protein n=1 Tax=Latimeria chalumnae TaxID=7897 RepID=H3A5E6_LATCH
SKYPQFLWFTKINNITFFLHESSALLLVFNLIFVRPSSLLSFHCFIHT